MLGIADVLEWLKSLGAPADPDLKWTAYRLDAGKRKRIGVYQRDGGTNGTAIGGVPCTLTHVKRMTALVHWNANARDTEAAAQELYDALAACGQPRIGTCTASYVALPEAEPTDVGLSEDGTCERVIRFDIYYQKG